MAEALDQVVLEQQRLGLAAGDRELHGPRRRHHADQACRQARRLGVGPYAAPQRAGLADIENLAVAGDHAIDAGLARQRVDEFTDDPHAVGKRALTSRRVVIRFQIDVGFVAHEVLPQGAHNRYADAVWQDRGAMWGSL